MLTAMLKSLEIFNIGINLCIRKFKKITIKLWKTIYWILLQKH